MTRIAVLTGGSTPERDVALAGAGQVIRALRTSGHTVAAVDTVHGALSAADEARLLGPNVGRAPPTFEELGMLAAKERPHALIELADIGNADVVFLVLHGRQGEGGEIQALLELAGIKYTGSDVLSSAVAMDKDIAKRLFRAASIPTPNWLMWRPGIDPTSLGFPVVVKPSNVGSSVGMSVVTAPEGIEEAVNDAKRYDDEVMLECYVEGRELTVGVLEDRALAVGEIIPQHETFDYECKYTPGMTDEVFPAEISTELRDQIRDLALAVHRTLKLRDFSRVDFRIDATGTPLCLEVNTLPGLTTTSLLPQSAAAQGIPFEELCDSITQAALGRATRVEQSPRVVG